VLEEAGQCGGAFQDGMIYRLATILAGADAPPFPTDLKGHMAERRVLPAV
jgi:hypothetical protein